MANRNNGLRTPGGGRGRGFVQNHVYIPYSRSDQNKFEILSGLQDGDDSSEREVDIDSDGFLKVRKRQRVNTGGDDNDMVSSAAQYRDADFDADFDNMGTDEKLSQIFNTLRCNQQKITHVEQKIDSINRLNGRIQRVETVVSSYNDRLKLLEYKSIDIEARSRRNNLLFRGIPESRNEDCKRVILNILEDKLGVDEPPVIERVHRLGRYNRLRGPRPIIAAFSFFRDTEDILSMTGSLKGTPISINRDYPNEITNARRTLWPQFKSARANTLNRVCIVYPAKLLVNGAVVSDMFPEWDRIMRGSRLSLEASDSRNYSNQAAVDRNSAQLNRNTEPYAEAMDTQEPVRAPYSSATHIGQNLHEFGQGQCRGIGRGIGRGLTFDYESSDRNSAPHTAWGGGSAPGSALADKQSGIFSKHTNNQSTENVDMFGLPVEPDQNIHNTDQDGNSVRNSCNVPDEPFTQGGNPVQNSTSVPDESVTQGANSLQLNTLLQPRPQLTLQSVDPGQNSVQKQSHDNNENTPDASVNNSPMQSPCAHGSGHGNKPNSNASIAMATENHHSPDGKQSSADDKSVKTQAKDKGFLSPRSLADSLLRSLPVTKVKGNQSADLDTRGTHRSRSKQRSAKPLNAAHSVGRKKRSITLDRVNLDRTPIRKPPDRDHSTESNTPNSK